MTPPLRYWALLVTSAAALAVFFLGERVRENVVLELENAGRQRLELYSATFSNAIDKYAYLPNILGRDGDIRALLRSPNDADMQDRVNRKLSDTNGDAGAATLFLMDNRGQTLAASNWREPNSYVGHSYSFRPYFQQAVVGETGRWFGVGVTTQIPGYFLARAIHDDGRVCGVAVVKIDLEPLQREWGNGGEWVMVTDANQVAVLSSRVEWKYGTLKDPSPELAAEIALTRQYFGIPLKRLEFEPLQRRSPQSMIIRQGSRTLLMQSVPLTQDGWTIYYFSDLAPAAGRQRDTVAAASAAILAIALLVLYLRQRRLRQQAEMEARAAIAETLRQARDELERKVDERTTELMEAQEELIQAGKMAALGQMSAALAHEVNNPLAAIQTFLASTRVFAERGDTGRVLSNLDMIGDLAHRMAEITGHLKTFARKTPNRREPVDISTAVERALMLLEPALRQDDILVERQVPPGHLMLGDAIRLEQVLVNLLRNAIDALKDVEIRRLGISIEDGGEEWILRVADSGPGIGHDVGKRLFEPFFTTKDVGQGLGLGLSLSYGIVRDFGGSIRAEPNEGGGAVFVIHLPKVP